MEHPGIRRSAGTARAAASCPWVNSQLALAATFSPSLARQYGQVIGAKELGKGAAVNLGPTVNIDRDPRSAGRSRPSRRIPSSTHL